MPQQEAWLEGELENVSRILMPAAHALAQAQGDIGKAASDLSAEKLWQKPNVASSVGFHLKHVAGSIDRLLTDARGESLSDEQFEFLRAETEIDENVTAEDLIEQAANAIEKMLEAIRKTPDEVLFEERFVVSAKTFDCGFRSYFSHCRTHAASHRKNLYDRKIVSGATVF